MSVGFVGGGGIEEVEAELVTGLIGLLDFLIGVQPLLVVGKISPTVGVWPILAVDVVPQ